MTQPNDLDIAYCKEHRRFLDALMEERGGWRTGDWCCHEQGELAVVLGWNRALPDVEGMRPFSVHRRGPLPDGHWSPETYHEYYMTWLPTEGDVLEVLERVYSNAVQVGPVGAWAFRPDDEKYRAEWVGKTVGPTYGATRRIALLELLASVKRA